ncbi:hypothetical protein MSAN_01506300 [Mycena sanguinolenta]|uniref:Protein kinase domain-containing protein n=1 Tax=Mycena sanguinolenta TaxID=230812 RepID=A0A8H7CYU1_9AGAR|nr:hypothetical protein MSAN_01506300 [Mycena sanguinolenta]
MTGSSAMQQLLFAYWLRWKVAVTVVVSFEFKSFGCAPFFKSLVVIDSHPLILDLPSCCQIRWAKAVNSASIPLCFAPSSSMDPQADSDEEFIVLSTSDYTESPSYALLVSAVVLWLNFIHCRYPSAQAAGLKSSAELLIKSIGFLPSLLGARVTQLQASGTTRTHVRKYSETLGRKCADHHSVTNNYYINGGRGGSGGEGGDQGGDGGIGQGPTVYFSQPQAPEASGIQTIRLEDIKLTRTIRLDPHSDVVGCRSRGVGVRRIYHAEIRRDPGTVTVAMYQGDGAEDEWRQDVAKYELIRHPNVMQLYGLVSTKKLYAMVFHDGTDLRLLMFDLV